MSAVQTTDRIVYPVCITREGGRGRPRRIERLPNGCWRVDWDSGIVHLYGADPTEHLRLGYEPGRRS